MQDRKLNIIVTSFTVMTTVMMFIGISFAYFANTVNGNLTNTININAAKVGSITLDVGSDIEYEMDYDNSFTKTFTVTATPSDIEQHLLINIDYTNPVPYLNYTVSRTSISVGGNTVDSGISDIVTENLANGTFDSSNTAQTLTLASLDIKGNTSTVVLTYTLTVTMGSEGGGNGSLTGTIYGALNPNKMYYYNDYHAGSTQPS